MRSTADELIEWSRENMANYKVPRYVELVDALPLNASNKVLKYELVARAAKAMLRGQGLSGRGARTVRRSEGSPHGGGAARERSEHEREGKD